MDMGFNFFRKRQKPKKKWLFFWLFAAASLSLVFPAQQVLALDNDNTRETLVKTLEGEVDGIVLTGWREGPCQHILFDTHDLPNSGRIEVQVWIGGGKPWVSFSLGHVDTAGNNSLVDKAFNIQPNSTATLTHNFSLGGKEFDLAICAGWDSPVGETNSVRYQFRVWRVADAKVTELHFIRKNDSGTVEINEISYNEPFYIKVEYNSEPKEKKKTVMLNWSEGPGKPIIVNQKTDNKKIYLSDAIYAKRPE